MDYLRLLHGPKSFLDVFEILYLAASIALLFWFIARYFVRRQARPRLTKADILYRESFASGASHKNILTKMGGASGCLRLIVTRDLLWITAWFPFGFFASIYDLEQVVPLSAISSLERKRKFGRDYLLISFTNTLGERGTVAIWPKDPAKFLQALRLAPEVLHEPAGS